MIGIYKITSPTNRVYIGQSENIDYRWLDYKRLRCKSQIRLYRSLKKYGFDKHLFQIIEECSLKKLNERERYWQEYFNVIGKKGLNCKYVSTNDKKEILSENIKQKISKTLKSKNLIGKINKDSKKCYQYDLDGNFIKQWDCMSDITRELNFSLGIISRCCSGKTRTAHKFRWFYIYQGKKIQSIKIKECINNIKNNNLFLMLKLTIEKYPNYSIKMLAKYLLEDIGKITRMCRKHKEKLNYKRKYKNHELLFNTK
jgi:hypothetical protein